MQDLKHCKPSTEPSLWEQAKEGIAFVGVIGLGMLLLALASTPAKAACQNINGFIYCQQDYRNDSNSPKIIDQNGNYRGNLNGNIYDPNSISNRFGRYGNPYSPDSLNNPYAVPLNNYNYGYGR